MAFRRRKRRYGKRKRRSFKRRRTRKSVYRLAKRAYKYATQDRGIYATQLISTGITDDPLNIFNVFLPIQGVDLANRLGDEVTVLKFKARGALVLPISALPSTALPHTFARVVCFLDKAALMYGVPADYTQLFISSNPVDVPDTFAFRNPAHYSRFKILYDKTFIFGSATTSYKRFKFNIKLNKKMVFQTNTGATADLSDWGIFIAVVSNSPGPLDPNPHIPALSMNTLVTFLR